jgi:hypothetical protein
MTEFEQAPLMVATTEAWAVLTVLCAGHSK